MSNRIIHANQINSKFLYEWIADHPPYTEVEIFGTETEVRSAVRRSIDYMSRNLVIIETEMGSDGRLILRYTGTYNPKRFSYGR